MKSRFIRENRKKWLANGVRPITQRPSAIYTQQIPARGKMSGILLIKFYALHQWYNDVALFLPPSLPTTHTGKMSAISRANSFRRRKKGEREREREEGGEKKTEEQKMHFR